MKLFLALALIAIALPAYSQTNETTLGEIKGIVTDPNGDPVRGAAVYTFPANISFENIAPRSTVTNADGEFGFRGGFVLGPYRLYSKKEADGYPDLSDLIYADSKFEPETVTLTEDHPSATTTLTLGDMAAVLAGRVIDASTGAPLKAKLVFMDEEGNTHSVMVTGKYRTLLPAGKDVTLMVMVMSPDYASQVPVHPLQLASGQEMDMDIPISKR